MEDDVGDVPTRTTSGLRPLIGRQASQEALEVAELRIEIGEEGLHGSRVGLPPRPTGCRRYRDTMTRFGVQLPNFTGPPSDQLFEHVANLASAVDDAGFDSLWVMDHFFQLPALGGPDQPMLESYTLLGALAAVTRRVQLGTLVTGVTYRNPGILAKIVTTLDVISRGRAILGIGAAWYDTEHQGLGIDYPADRVRLDMLEEAVQVCRAMFTDDHVSFSGTHYRLDHA